MFKKILIANRGEIACRIIKTARRLGIATVAVYSDADRDALHVQMADEAVPIGPPPAAQSYLSIERIVAACRKTGAEAVHPGYGFLSENARFQEALAEAGITFIGPDANAIRAMGDKIESKKVAQAAGVSTVPGHLGVIRDADEAAMIALDIGFPVMIKASAGGGGKGMRLAANEQEVREGFVSAANEARSAFGDDRVFIEKYIERPRHIEIQVLGDSFGHVVYLGERECSIQRRHQKVIEEAPSPFLTEGVRKAMGEQAVALAKAVGYRSAGTVEFVVDARRNFYFLEMNTRLQVEHPVTELVTGLDLVEWMIRIAAGEPLTLKQENVRTFGWAIEARVYAEDPFRNFMPSTGRLSLYRPPPEGTSIRIDTGVFEGADITMHYDPMIAKLCAYGPVRELALAHMRQALDEFVVVGVSHNLPFLAALMAHRRFIQGDISTGFLAEEFSDGFSAEHLPVQDERLMVAVAAFIHRRQVEREATIGGQMKCCEMVPGDEWVVRFDGRSFSCSVAPVEGGLAVDMGGPTVVVKSNWDIGRRLFRGTVDDQAVVVQIERLGTRYRLSHSGSRADIQVLHPDGARLADLMPVKAPPDTGKYLLSPMPGLLMALPVEEGQEIRAGEIVAVVEAMKMENVLRAQRDGIIAKLHAKTGDSLAVDQRILEYGDA